MIGRADGGANICMKNINRDTGAKMPMTDSLRASDDASKAVQKTHNRIALDQILDDIVHEQIIYPESTPSMTICILTLKNGYVLVGKSAPADPENYNRELGKKFAREDAIRQAWPLFAFALRNKMMDRASDAYGGG